MITPPNKKGRGALSNRNGRFDKTTHEDFDDGWDDVETPPKLATQLFPDCAKSVISYNKSPDVPFDRSINPYRGCEHGCVYCFARPSHAYLGLSSGLDFETKIFYKPDAPALLRRELAAKSYRPAPVALGINTDAYQPAERQLKLTRHILEILQRSKHPVSIITKSSLVERDLDILTDMAQSDLIHVSISITTLDNELARRMEPRATAPKRRLQTVSRMASAGIPVSVLIAPLIPILNDCELENIMRQSRAAGAIDADYVFLRLPHDLEQYFKEWLREHEPLKAEHVMKRIYDSHGGKAYDPAFGERMRGTGLYADLIAQRFRLAFKKLRFPGSPPLSSDRFSAAAFSPQTDIFE